MTKRLKIQGYVEIPAYMSAEDFYGEINGVPMFFNDHDLDTFKLHLEAEEPAADVVEVVRCKDCRWWEARTHGAMIGRCENPLNGLVSEYCDDEDFCSYGERREVCEKD